MLRVLATVKGRLRRRLALDGGFGPSSTISGERLLPPSQEGTLLLVRAFRPWRAFCFGGAKLFELELRFRLLGFLSCASVGGCLPLRFVPRARKRYHRAFFLFFVAVRPRSRKEKQRDVTVRCAVTIR